METSFDLERTLDDALAHHRAGRLDLAQDGYRAVLDAAPDHPDALNFLGVLLQDIGDYADAQDVLQRAVAELPDFAEALTNLARVQQVTGQATAAAESARRAIVADPTLPEAYQQSGRALLDLLDYPAAEATLRRALHLQPDDVDSRIHLGAALLGLGQLTQAKQLHDSLPSNIHTLLKIAAAWLRTGRTAEATSLYQCAVDTDPTSANAHAGLAFACRADPQRAKAACERALELAPERADLWILLGRTLAHLGQFEQAASSTRHALLLEPHSVSARRDLAMIGSLAADDADSVILGATLQSETASKDEKRAAAFGLGAALDRGQHYGRAFEVYAWANQSIHAEREMTGKGFSLLALQRTVDWLIATFPATSFATRPVGDDELVFIVGMPRSGTSLVEQIAASHPDVYGAGEQKTIGDIVDRLNGGNQQKPPAAWAQVVATSAAQHAIDTLRAIAGPATRMVDKMPDNLFLLGHIAVLFPRARIILCTRDPRDICLSAYFQHFSDDTPWCYDLADCAAQAHEVARLVAHWRQMLPLRVLEVTYEDLIVDLEGQSRRLINFLGLAWHPACLAFHQTERPVMTASFWQVRQPLYRTSVARWKNYRKQLAGLNFALLGLIPAPEAEDWTHLLADPQQATAIALVHRRAGRLDAAAQIYDALLA
jgi:tetratricopeptide (TPR) repeat protein